jgi:DNA-binding NarL/FixJ family response regulator
MSGESEASQQGLPEPLTEREMEVLQLLGTGMTNKEIGAELFITERTVKFYVSAILGKLNASNRTEAVTIAMQRGLISLS